MLLFIAFSAAAVVPPARPEAQAKTAIRQATAMIRIERSARGNREAWEALPKLCRHEVIVHGENGEPIVLRLIEHE
jgi:hypothetical protein